MKQLQTTKRCNYETTLKSNVAALKTNTSSYNHFKVTKNSVQDPVKSISRFKIYEVLPQDQGAIFWKTLASVS